MSLPSSLNVLCTLAHSGDTLLSVESQQPVLLRKPNPGKKGLAVASAEVWGSCQIRGLSIPLQFFLLPQDCRDEAPVHVSSVGTSVRCRSQYRLDSSMMNTREGRRWPDSSDHRGLSFPSEGGCSPELGLDGFFLSFLF